MGWIISPSDDVVNNNDGSFVLPCSNTDVVYNITYVNDEGCSSNTVTYTYVTSGECGTCTDFMGNLDITASTLPAESASSMSFGHATLTDEYTAYTFSSSNTSMINNIGLGGNVGPNTYFITGTVYENTSSYGKSSTITVNAKGPNLPSTGCNDTFTLGQEAGGGGGSCPVSGDIINPQIVAAEGGTRVPIMHILKNSTYTGYTITPTSSSSMYVSNVNQGAHLYNDWYVVLADVTSNESSNSSRTLSFDVKMSGTTTPSSGCEYTVNVEQEEANSCADLDITASSVSFNSSGGSINVGTISGSHTVTKTSDSPSWITVNTSNGNISLSVNTTTVSRNGTVTFKVDDDTCDGQEVTVSQTTPVSVITYYSPLKANVNLNNFTPAATAETFSNGVGKVEFAETVTAIGEKAFSGKTTMTGIDIPNSITSIGNSAFNSCSSLTSVTIPNSVTSIGGDAFYSCSSLTSVTIPNSVTSIGGGAFQNCSSLRSVTIPSSVGSINNNLLYNCTSLSSVTLESETLQLKPYSISNCPNLRKIEMTSVTACPSDYQYALENSADCPIYVPEQYLDKFWNSSTFQYKDRVISHVGNQSIVYKANSKLDGDSLKNAYSGEYASSSTKLSILLHTFDSSTKIGKITYDGVVRSFHDGTFDTRAIDYIVLPENIKRIGQTVFQSSNLISIYFPDSLVGLCNSATDWGCDILHNCARLKTVVAGSGLTQIGYGCFSCADETSSLTGITFYSTTPPTLDHESTFGHTIHASIYVPCGQVSTYKSANIWNDSDIKGKIKAIPPCTS